MGCGRRVVGGAVSTEMTPLMPCSVMLMLVLLPSTWPITVNLLLFLDNLNPLFSFIYALVYVVLLLSTVIKVENCAKLGSFSCLESKRFCWGKCVCFLGRFCLFVCLIGMHLFFYLLLWVLGGFFTCDVGL